ncbi:MAG: LysR substrate-binding domain-containing protein [Desulfomonilaceae bacterium]
MNLEHVKSYLAVVRTGSYHKAAKHLGLAQPTVSQHIRKLEKTLGATLIIRDRNGCFMAPRTEAFARQAESLVRIADKARNALRRPTMTVGASTNVGTYLLQPMFKDFYEANRESLTLDLVIDRNDRIADRLESDEIDVAVMEWWDNRAGFVNRPWKKERLVVIVPPGHPWSTRKSISAEELMGERMIGGESATGTGRVLREALGDLMSEFHVAFKLGSTEAVKNAVQTGLGISMVLASSVVDEVKSGALKAIHIDGPWLEKELMVIHRRGLPSDSVAVRFAEKLTKENAVSLAPS